MIAPHLHQDLILGSRAVLNDDFFKLTSYLFVRSWYPMDDSPRGVRESIGPMTLRRK